MDLHRVLEEAKALGFLGPGAVEAHIEHARSMVGALQEARCAPTARILDLGSGGGIPGLYIAEALPDATVVLLDGAERRTDFLERAVRSLALTRCSVIAARAEEAGRDPALRGSFDVVVARSFGAPAVVAECGAPFLRIGGTLVVSEPPDATGDRWSDVAGLEQLGQVFDRVSGVDPGFAVLRQVALCPDHAPRRVGIPGRRPLF